MVTDRNKRPVQMMIEVDALTEKMLDIAMPKMRDPALRNAFIQSTLQQALTDELGDGYSEVQQAAENRLKYEEQEMFEEPTDVKRLLVIEDVTETAILELERLSKGEGLDDGRTGVGPSGSFTMILEQYMSDHVKNGSEIFRQVEEQQKRDAEQLKRAMLRENLGGEIDSSPTEP